MKTALSKSGIFTDGYSLNAYSGCAHDCRYCYAVFMKRFLNVPLPWGEFVIVKDNILEALQKDLERKRPATVWVSSVTDPYQPVEKRFRLTRGCIERLAGAGFTMSVLTKSPLVLCDIDIFRGCNCDVGMTITTDRADIAGFFEPRVAPPQARIETLKKLSDAGIATHVFVGPALPMNPEPFARLLRSATSRVLVDRMNYTDRVSRLYESRGLGYYLTDAWFERVKNVFLAEFGADNVTMCWA